MLAARLVVGVVGEDGFLPGGGFDVGVDFGREDALVAEHFLDDAEVGAVFDHVGGKGMAEGVGRDFLVDAGEDGLALDHVENRSAREMAAVFVEENSVVGVVVRGWAGGPVGGEGGEGFVADRHEALLVALADHPHEGVVFEDVAPAEPDGFRYAEPAAVEDFEQGTVAKSAPGGKVDRLHYGVDLLDRHD